MRRGMIMLIVVVMLPLAAAADPPGPTPDVRVKVGAAPPGGEPLPFSYTRFYPERLRVHRGQTVEFEMAESKDLHSVSFARRSGVRQQPILRNNEAPERIAINEVHWQRSGCGSDGQAACRLDGSGGHLTSGLFMSGSPRLFGTTWRVTVDRPVGTRLTYACAVHPGMTGSIEVVGAGVALPSQAELDAQTAQQIAADTDEAIRHREYLDGLRVKRSEDGHDVWRVLVGDATPSGHVSIMAYMPGTLTDVPPGDAVEFVSSGMGHHSVTFSSDMVGRKDAGTESRLAFSAIHPMCDFDELNGGAPGIPGPFEPFAPLPCPASFELVVAPWLASGSHAPADLVVSPASYHDSGLMWSEQAPTVARARPDGSGFFPHSFLAVFPLAGPFGFACTVHGAEVMAGTIIVA